MPLDDAQRQKIQQHLNSKGVRLQCPACGRNDFELGQMVATPEFSGGGMSIGGPTVPAVQIVCKHCGYMMHFAAKLLGIV